MFVAIHYQDTVHEIPQRRIDQQGHHDNLIVATRVSGLPDGLVLNQRVRDSFEPLPSVVVCKHNATQCRSIEFTVVLKDRVAEFMPYLVQRGHAGLDNLPCDDVRVDDLRTEFAKNFGNRGFAAGNAAGQCNPECPTWGGVNVVGVLPCHWLFLERNV